ncbi:MAG: hypothetical protein Q9221_003770 [Calogaya cf. arnoldii]
MTLAWCQHDQPDNFELSTTSSRPQLDPEPLEENLGPRRYASHPHTQLNATHHEEEQALPAATSLRLSSSLSQSLLMLMSRSPLISHRSSTIDHGSYGAVLTHSVHSHEDLPKPNEESSYHVGRRDTPDNHPSGSDSSHNSSRKARNRVSNISSRSSRRRIGDGIITVAEDSADDDDDDDPPDNSRYSQVRASVSAIDDLTASISTPRMWILSLLCALLGSGSNLFFSLRYPSVFISPVIALVVVHPLGLAWDRLFKRDDDPAEAFDCGVLVERSLDQERPATTSRLDRLRRWLGQGRWNEKEHACVYISSNVSFGFAFATDVGDALVRSLEDFTLPLHKDYDCFILRALELKANAC